MTGAAKLVARLLDLPDKEISEVPELTNAVVALAKEHRWRVFRVRQGRPGWNLGSGFPDLVMVRNGVILFVELKKQSAVLDPRQAEWMVDLTHAEDRNPNVRALVWRPSDLRSGAIEAVLR